MFSMKLNRVLVLAIAFCASGAITSRAFTAESEVVTFRLAQWKSAHFDDAKTAQANFATFKQLGCEAEQQQHGGHFDVRYRCVQWRSIALASHNEAHQWERWLKTYGFETSHQH